MPLCAAASGRNRLGKGAFPWQARVWATPVKEMQIMIRTYVTSAIAGAFALGLATAALAATGEFNNLCAQGLATGQKIETDCSINAQVDGKTYCFGSEDAKAAFMKDPQGNVAKAQQTYEKQKAG
jgi:YHS domain-containing protein